MGWINPDLILLKPFNSPAKDRGKGDINRPQSRPPPPPSRQDDTTTRQPPGVQEGGAGRGGGRSCPDGSHEAGRQGPINTGDVSGRPPWPRGGPASGCGAAVRFHGPVSSPQSRRTAWRCRRADTLPGLREIHTSFTLLR